MPPSGASATREARAGYSTADSPRDARSGLGGDVQPEPRDSSHNGHHDDPSEPPGEERG